MTPSNDAETTVVGACPLDCPDACSWVVTLDDGGVPVKLRGNGDHPYTRKGLCVKVNPYLEYTRHPDRLLHPLRRVGRKGEGRFAQVSWDEALGGIAERLQGVIDEFGGEALWPYIGTGNMGYIQGIESGGSRLFRALGASQHFPNICSAAAYPGLEHTSGRGSSMDPMDLVHADLVMLWGANTVSTNQHLWPFVKQAQDRGAKVVVVDPLTTRTAERADVHLAIRPGTDGALALGLLAHVVATGRVDKAADHALGWDEFVTNVLTQWSVERAAAECGIEPNLIRQVAELMTAGGPTALRLGMGMQRHAAGGQASRLISLLPMATGNFDRLGGGLCYSTGPLYALNVDRLQRRDLAPGPTRTLAMTRLGEGLLDLDDPPVKALVILAANPMASNPDQNRVRAGLERDDLFTVVVENFQTDTADYADYILPSTMQTEHLDMYGSVSHLYLNFNNPVAEPAGECLSHTEIFRRLAKAMGRTEPELFVTDMELVADALDADHPAIAGIDIDELRRTGFVRLGLPEPYLPFAERFDTPSGRFEVASEVADAAGFGRLPHYVAPREAVSPVVVDGAVSLALVAHGNHYLMNSIFGNSSDHAKAGEPVVTVHPSDAATRHLVEGAQVRVSNERGAFVATVAVNDRTRRGVAAMTKGHWPKLSGGSTINATTLETDADMGRGAIFHDNQVWITPAVGGADAM